MRLALVLADQALDGGGGRIAVPASIAAGEDAEVELGILALGGLGDDGLPVIVVGGVGDLAAGVVVELDEESVKLGLVDELLELEPGVRGRALRGSRDVIVAVAAELLNHPDPRLLVGCGPY